MSRGGGFSLPYNYDSVHFDGACIDVRTVSEAKYCD